MSSGRRRPSLQCASRRSTDVPRGSSRRPRWITRLRSASSSVKAGGTSTRRRPILISSVTILNDFSARDLQATASRTGMGPAPGKDWANALGPCIVTRDEFGELRDQAIVVRVNNEERLRDRYRSLVHENPWVREGQRALWSFPEMLEFLSRFQPIHAGEVWGSGTIPGGCELERGDRARYLKPGDRIEIEIEGIGVLENSIAASV